MTHLAPFDSAEVVAQVLLGSLVAVPAALMVLSTRPAATSALAGGRHDRGSQPT